MPSKTCCGRPLKAIGSIGWWKFHSCPKCGAIWRQHRASKVWRKETGC